jgi:multidrug resistance protein, MATE family
MTIDRIYLGNFSTEALAATMAVTGVFWTPMAFLQQTAAYVATFVAQYFGAKEYLRIGPAVWQSLYVSVGGGILFLVLIPLAPFLFNFFGHAESLRQLENEYFTAICFSALPTAVVAAVSGFYTGLGRTQIIMWINGVGLIANVILDYVMIFGNFGFPAMGVAGAGYATALASLASGLFGLYLIFSRKHEFDFGLKKNWHYSKELMSRFIRYGLPSGLQWALEGLAFTSFLIIIGRMSNGSAALASSSIVVTVMMLAVLPAMGVAQAAAVLVGQSLGEKKPEQAEASTWSALQVAAMYIFTVALTFLIFPQFYLSWFHNASDPDMWAQVSTMVPYLLIFLASFTTFDSMNLIFSFALKGAGDTRFVSFVALAMPWPLMVLPTWFVKDWSGAIYWAWGFAALYIILQAFVFLWRFRQGKWKQMSVIN